MGKTSFRKGRFYANRDGSGKVVVITDYIDREGQHVVNRDEYPVEKENVLGAIDGDKVIVDIFVRKGTASNVITEIVGRELQYIAGEVYCVGDSYFVKPIDKKKQTITISLDKEAIEGQRVAVVLDEGNNNFYKGQIIRTFGHKDDPDMNNEDGILWQAFKCGISDKFSDESLEQVRRTPMVVLDSDRVGRHDITDWEIFTIDGVDSKNEDVKVKAKTRRANQK